MIRRLFFLAVLFTLALLLASPLLAGDRGIAVGPGAPAGTGWGDFHALIVGIDKYQEWTPLRTAVKDAAALKQVLVSRYGFAEDRVVLLTDAEASRGRIILALRNMAAGLKKTDNLLIYYAGHGQVDDLTGDGYWIPAEGKLKDPTTWVAHSIIKTILSSDKVRAKNVVLVADACYSGTLLREGPSMLSIERDDYTDKLRAAAARPSRQVITSGGMEPVADGGKDGHSLFAYYLLKALKENDREVVDLENLFHTRVWKPVTEIGHQRPNVGRLQTPMDDDGQFVLTNRAAVKARVEQAAAEKQRLVEQQQWKVQIEEERARIEAERQRLEAEKQLLVQKRELEMEKLKIEQEKQRLALETEKAKLAAEKQSMKTAALSAPAPAPESGAPLKIGLMPWKFNMMMPPSNRVITERASSTRIFQAVFEDPRFRVSHSFYDYRPASEYSEGEIAPISLPGEEAKSLWKKNGFFSRSEPDPEAVVPLAKKLGIDVVLFLDCYNGNAKDLMVLTLIDVDTGKIFRKEAEVNYLSYTGQLESELRKQLNYLVKSRG